MKKNKKEMKQIYRYGQFILGLIILSISFNLFLLPNDFVIGGVSGMSIIFYRLFAWDTSLFIFITSVLLLVISYIFLGKEKTASSILGSLLFPLFVKLTSNISSIIVIENNHLLISAIFGALSYGFGLGLCLKNGFTTGGTDIINQIISKYTHISIGNALLICEGAIVISASTIFGITKLLYDLVILYLNSNIVDKVILGISDSKAFYIITNYDKEVQELVTKNLNHGITIFNAKGGYKNGNKKMLFCVIPTKDYFKLKESLEKIDPSAFFVATDAYEVHGGE